MNQLKNKTALITGASSGIGKAMAFSLASRGCELYLLARREDKLKQTEKEIAQLYPKTRIHLITCDIQDPDLGLILEAVTKGKLDILINNAGLALGKDRVEE